MEICKGSDELDYSRVGNTITVGTGDDLPKGKFKTHPIQVHSSEISLRDDSGVRRLYRSGFNGLGAIFLRPLEHGKLDLVVWGVDTTSLAIAARLVPILTGVGQPDFIIVTRECLWKGVDGALALGYFDGDWNVSTTSYLEG